MSQLPDPTTGFNQSAGPDELSRKFKLLRRWQAAGKVVTAVTVVAVAGLFARFAVGTRDEVRGNFTDERTLAALHAAVPKVAPVVGGALREVATEAAPVYQKLAAERFQAVRNNLGAKAVIRLQALPEEAGKLMATRLHDTFDRVLARIGPDLKATFPALTDEQRRDVVIDHFLRTIDDRNRHLAGKIDTIVVNESAKVHAILEKFELPPDTLAGSDEELHREFVRTLLVLAEQELADSGRAAPPAAARTTASLGD